MIFFRLLTCFILIYLCQSSAQAEKYISKRIPQFENTQVIVWKTIIYPHVNQKLKMHRHEHNRILVSLDDGTLKIINDKNDIHYLHLKKNQAYYLKKDTPGETHTDENKGNQPIKVLVIELKN